MIVDVNQIKFYIFLSAALAQLVEHLIRNERVRCSSHLSSTIFPDKLSKALNANLLWYCYFIFQEFLKVGNWRRKNCEKKLRRRL